jgi:hypothetical protein
MADELGRRAVRQVSPATNVTVVTAGPPNYSDCVEQSGRPNPGGGSISFTSRTIFATWFTYDANGKGRGR